LAESNTSRAVATDEAIDWFLRQRETDFSVADKLALAEWLLLSPLHVDEYLAVTIAWDATASTNLTMRDRDILLAAARAEIASDKVVPLRVARAAKYDETHPSRRRRGRSKLWACAAMFAVVIGAGAVWIHIVGRDAVYTTARGEERRVVLADGSVITLNTDSSVRVALSPRRRDIGLMRGEVRFQVAKDPARPFVVKIREVEVRALGTVFNVRVEDRKVHVAVLEGHVAVRAAEPAADALAGARTPRAASAELHTGERAVVDDGLVVVGSGQALASVNAWMERKLVFRDETLASVVEEFNRYRIHPLKLDDADLASMRISGVFSLEDPESLLTFLKRFEAVDIHRADDGFDHLVNSARDR
jgi:transmembrane sensor